MKAERERNEPKVLSTFYKERVFPIMQEFNKHVDDAEILHNSAIWIFSFLQNFPWFLDSVQRSFEYNHSSLRTNIGGIELENPFGLAAGFDKNCRAPFSIQKLFGFGLLTFGTVTRYQQEGRKEYPRIVRLDEDGSAINFMGFPSWGGDRVLSNIIAARKLLDPKVKINVSIGINTDRRTVEQMRTDLTGMTELFYPHVNFLEVCFSCPNIEGLCAFQKQEDQIIEVIGAVTAKRDELAKKLGKRIDVLYKVPPDSSDEAVDRSIRIKRSTGMDGFVATNTSAQRPKNLLSRKQKYPGGLSGRALEPFATATVWNLYERSGGELIIGAGGVNDGRTAARKIMAGARAVVGQTAIPFRGFDFVPESCKELVALKNRGGFGSVTEMIGYAHTHRNNKLVKELFPEK